MLIALPSFEFALFLGFESIGIRSLLGEALRVRMGIACVVYDGGGFEWWCRSLSNSQYHLLVSTHVSYTAVVR